MAKSTITPAAVSARDEYRLALVLARRARRGDRVGREIMASNYFSICRPDLWSHALQVAGM